MLGLNTCWVAGGYKRGCVNAKINSDEKLVCVIALGYGENQGVPHKSKSIRQVCKAEGELPKWFRKGVEAALMAPTAMNQQKFSFSYSGNRVKARAGLGPYCKVDLGIAKYHFELGAGAENFVWK